MINNKNVLIKTIFRVFQPKFRKIKLSGCVGDQGAPAIDATVADQMIAYPTDLGLLSRSREESERIIDELCNMLNINEKPRTYRRLAREQYLNVARKKNKTRNELRKAIGGIQ